MPKKAITLLELNNAVRNSLNTAFPEQYWVIAEISEIRENRNGHCYLELVEKDEVNDRFIARSRAVIWANTYKMLKPFFEDTTGRELGEGLKILTSVTVEFHELYGFSLNIKDIDPNYTLGDIERQKQEAIAKLKEEGVYDMNKSLDAPVVFQKIAVISSKTAAGYGDFCDQLQHNPYGYKFYLKLFPSIMQGEQAESSIIHTLERIYEYENLFDAVVIIRGGGAKADLHCFNSYWLAYHVAQFPLPVITGIGHERDETVTDMVAFRKMKTPTAVAEFLVNKAGEFDNILNNLKETFIEIVEQRMDHEKNNMRRLNQQLLPVVNSNLENNKHLLKMHTERLRYNIKMYANNRKNEWLNYKYNLKTFSHALIDKKRKYFNNYSGLLIKNSRYFLYNKKSRLDIHNNTICYIDPAYILKKGYSYTMKNNKVITGAEELKHDDIITTRFYKGEAVSVVKKTKKV